MDHRSGSLRGNNRAERWRRILTPNPSERSSERRKKDRVEYPNVRSEQGRKTAKRREMWNGGSSKIGFGRWLFSIFIEPDYLTGFYGFFTNFKTDRVKRSNRELLVNRIELTADSRSYRVDRQSNPVLKLRFGILYSFFFWFMSWILYRWGFRDENNITRNFLQTHTQLRAHVMDQTQEPDPKDLLSPLDETAHPPMHSIFSKPIPPAQNFVL